MIGLVLQGGGVRGSYQIGAYMALKKAKIKFDGVTGTSIGAFNGALIAAGKEKELLRFWTNVSVGEILGFPSLYIQKRIQQEYDLSYIKLATQNIWNIIKTRGISTKGLEQVLQEYLNPNDLIKSRMDFGLCTVRVHDLKPLYIFKEEMKQEKINDYILASCYLPCFKMERKVDNHFYLDGGFYDNTPINMLIDKGYEKIYVIELNPLINRKQKIKKEVEIIKITPKRSLGGILNLDSNKIIDNIKMGYFDALRVVKKLDGYYYCFKKRPDWLYQWMLRKIDRKKREKIMLFFNAHTEKKGIIKAMEYVMQHEKIDYYQVYSPLKMLKKLQKTTFKKHFVYEFIQELQIL